MSEDILDGTACALCMSYFIDKQGELYSHGCPVVCFDCWKDLSTEDKQKHIKAKVKTMYALFSFTST